MTELTGKKAPNFKLPTDGNGEISLEELKGKRVILYFYPKDNTPGCTKESEGFRDHKADFENENTVIIGVSKDSVKSHDNFKSKYNLPFTLISDTECKMCEDYGVWVEKSMYGRKYMGIERSTFLIDEEGIVQKEWRKVKVPGHVENVLSSVKEL